MLQSSLKVEVDVRETIEEVALDRLFWGGVRRCGRPAPCLLYDSSGWNGIGECFSEDIADGRNLTFFNASAVLFGLLVQTYL